MKKHFLLLCACALFVALRSSAAEAINSYAISSTIIGFVFGGAGFAFSPTQPISVTSLGFGGSVMTPGSEPYQISLWDAGGIQLASTLVTFSSPVFNTTHYVSVPAVGLSAGQTYYLSAVGVNTGQWTGDAIIIPPAVSPTGSISVSPDITYLGAVTGGLFPTSASLGVFDVGANFQYVVPEPSMLALGGLGAAGLLFLRRRAKDSIRNP